MDHGTNLGCTTMMSHAGWKWEAWGPFSWSYLFDSGKLLLFLFLSKKWSTRHFGILRHQKKKQIQRFMVDHAGEVPAGSYTAWPTAGRSCVAEASSGQFVSSVSHCVAVYTDMIVYVYIILYRYTYLYLRYDMSLYQYLYMGILISIVTFSPCLTSGWRLHLDVFQPLAATTRTTLIV